MTVRQNYAHVHEAAKILGVAPNTIRAWGATGKIPEYRHPVNGYRLYKRDDLAEMLQRLQQPVAVSAPAAPDSTAAQGTAGPTGNTQQQPAKKQPLKKPR